MKSTATQYAAASPEPAREQPDQRAKYEVQCLRSRPLRGLPLIRRPEVLKRLLIRVAEWWPDPQMSEAEFVTELLERTGAWLLLDVANVHANARNKVGDHDTDPAGFFDRLPLERLAYVHVAGGIERDGLYHDTHTFPTPGPVLDLLEELAARAKVPGALLERDDRFPPDAELLDELQAIAAAVSRGDLRRKVPRLLGSR